MLSLDIDAELAKISEIIRNVNKDFDGDQLQAKLLLDWPVKTDKSVYHPETIRLCEKFRESLKQGS